MASPSDFTTWNMEQSLAGHVASRCIAAGWLVYWYATDAVEITGATPYYPQWSTNRATYLADATFAAALANSRGIITLRGPVPANPTFVQRLTSDGLQGAPEEITLPAVAMEVLTEQQLRLWELGTNQLWLRSRQALLFGFLRSREEQVLLADVFRLALQRETTIALVDHTGAGATVGEFDIIESDINTDIVFDETESETFSLDVRLRLDYIV